MAESISYDSSYQLVLEDMAPKRIRALSEVISRYEEKPETILARF